MNEVWHDVIDLQLWEMTSITDECFEVDGGNRYMNSADIEGLIAEVKRLREQQQKILRIAETNMAVEWGDTDASAEWAYIIDMIKGDD